MITPRPECFGRMAEMQAIRSCESDEVHCFWIWACAREQLAKPLVAQHDQEVMEHEVTDRG